MGALEWLTAAGIVVGFAGLVGSVFHHFLSKADAAQQKEIDEIRRVVEKESTERKHSLERAVEEKRFAIDKLVADQREINALMFNRREDDLRQLQNLEKTVASEHYKRGELDLKFDRMEAAIKAGIEKGFDSLNKRFDQLGCGSERRKSGSCDS